MASETSVARTSFTAYFELIADGKSYSLGQVASDFVILTADCTDNTDEKRKRGVVLRHSCGGVLI
ncbi:MAG: hypothetical protein R3C17_14875 [Planctomycetaceae bacterium]